MKYLTIVVAILMIGASAGFLHAEAGCSSCASVESCSKSYTEDACVDDACTSTEAGHNHKESASKEEARSETGVLDTVGLKTLIDSGVPMIVLDARSGEYDDGKRIPGALSLNSESKPEEIAKVLPNKEALVVTYCANLQCPASSALNKHLKSLGYSNLREYPEGIQGWIEAGNPVKSVK
ncbi:MAG: rhodanese-like domain-containing protein [Candidatus Riflebacteria bacterium]|nr:rhodanese-like domain-containing protein [Candidatus Riflebacteria bacterium]